MPVDIVPVSAVVPTKNRAAVLRKTLESLVAQTVQPQEIVLTDASDDVETRELCTERFNGLGSEIIWLKANQIGAASQRNEGMAATTQPVIWFFDDDILFEPDCVGRLWHALQSDSKLGGVNAMIINQRYNPPGLASRVLFQLLNGRSEESYAGRVIGPAINLLPEDREDLPEVVTVQWLNTTCTLYRREALPSPPFDSVFVGYSMMEDLTLSLRVGRHWKLANARTARIFHDSQPGTHKADVSVLAAMELTNRHYVMTKVLRKRHILDYLRLFVWEMFQLGVCAARSDSRPMLWHLIMGKWRAVSTIAARIH